MRGRTYTDVARPANGMLTNGAGSFYRGMMHADNFRINFDITIFSFDYVLGSAHGGSYRVIFNFAKVENGVTQQFMFPILSLHRNRLVFMQQGKGFSKGYIAGWDEKTPLMDENCYNPPLNQKIHLEYRVEQSVLTFSVDGTVIGTKPWDLKMDPIEVDMFLGGGHAYSGWVAADAAVDNFVVAWL